MTALQVLPINYGGLVLTLLGIGLLISELFVPSFGILGIGGILAFVLGSLLLFDTPTSTLSVDPNIVYAAAATLGAFTLWVSYLVVRTQRRRPSLGVEGLVGEVGEVRQRIDGRRGGKVFVQGEYWSAVADAPIDVGERVQVVGIEGMQLTVRLAASHTHELTARSS
ncbi:MAG: serine protease, partial [Deltaproteobacteria bacterium]|nr:serine protease [Deltaproteobacteria bacterium]